MKAFINSRIFDGERFIEKKVLLVDRQKIAGLSDEIPVGAEVTDCNGGIISPGFIDLQIYGGGGFFFSAYPTPEALTAIADGLVKKGTTGFFITLATNNFEVFGKAARAVRECQHPAVLGLHLEGPYINPVKKGAHLEKYIMKPDVNHLKQFLEDAGGVVKMMTLAPEMCNRESIQLLLDYNVLLSAGHSNATFAEAKEGFDNGIQTATHLFNAMSPFHHRDVGLPGAIFSSDSVRASVIPDGIHVDFEAIKIAKRLMGERLFFITDALEEVREGDYIHIRQKDRFTLPDGTLSGSALTMPLCIKNSVEKIGFTPEESLRMATSYPTKLAQLRRKGRIKAGDNADIVCLTKDYELQFTVFKGEVIKP